MTTTAIQRAVRPIIFDDAHLGAIISDFRYVGSKHNVVIDGHAMLLRGLNQIDNFIDNASRAVREAKVKREF